MHPTDTRSDGTQFRYDDDTRQFLDEIIAHDVQCLHLEAMGDAQFWIGLTLANGEYWHINLGARNERAKGYCLAELQAEGDA